MWNTMENQIIWKYKRKLKGTIPKYGAIRKVN